MLLLYYYEAREDWAPRYVIYEQVIKFILLKVWQDAKPILGKRRFFSLREFFAAGESADFPQKFPEEAAIFDALCELGWQALYENEVAVHRTTEVALKAFFVEWLRDPAPGRVARIVRLPDPQSPGPDRVAARAADWFEVLKKENLFIPDEPPNFHFIHSTVLEFFAAAWLRSRGVQKEDIVLAASRPGRETLDTFPMLCGADWQEAHRLLPLLRDALPATARASTLPFRCLAETELAELRALTPHIYDRVRRPLEQRMEETRAKDWIYEGLADWLWNSDSTRLAELTSRCASGVPLVRPIFTARFLERHLKVLNRRVAWNELLICREIPVLPVTAEVDNERYLARRALLETVLNKPQFELLDQQPNTTIVIDPTDFAREISNLPPEPTYDPEDQNLDYFRSLLQASTKLTGFLGSPNFRHGGSVRAVAFAPPNQPSVVGLAASASDDGLIVVWDLRTGRELRRMSGHRRGVTSLAWSADAQRILSGSDDRSIKLWDTDSCQLLRSFKGHSGSVNSCALSHDAQRILSGSSDNSLKLWDAKSGLQIRSFKA